MYYTNNPTYPLRCYIYIDPAADATSAKTLIAPYYWLLGLDH